MRETVRVAITEVDKDGRLTTRSIVDGDASKFAELTAQTAKQFEWDESAGMLVQRGE